MHSGWTGQSSKCPFNFSLDNCTDATRNMDEIICKILFGDHLGFLTMGYIPTIGKDSHTRPYFWSMFTKDYRKYCICSSHCAAEPVRSRISVPFSTKGRGYVCTGNTWTLASARMATMSQGLLGLVRMPVAHT